MSNSSAIPGGELFFWEIQEKWLISSASVLKLIYCCLTTNGQFFSYFMAITSYIRWDDDHVCFVLDQHTYLDFYSADAQTTDMLLHFDALSWIRTTIFFSNSLMLLVYSLRFDQMGAGTHDIPNTRWSYQPPPSAVPYYSIFHMM